jgi:hypothetical protein
VLRNTRLGRGLALPLVGMAAFAAPTIQSMVAATPAQATAKCGISYGGVTTHPPEWSVFWTASTGCFDLAVTELVTNYSVTFFGSVRGNGTADFLDMKDIKNPVYGHFYDSQARKDCRYAVYEDIDISQACWEEKWGPPYVVGWHLYCIDPTANGGGIGCGW